MAFRHLVVLIPHDGGTVDIGGHLPAKALIEQVVLGRGAEILAAPDHMGDAHQVVVDDVGKIVGGQTVPFEEYLVVQRGVVHGDIPKDGVVEGGGSGLWDSLPDDEGLSRIHPCLCLLGAEGAAGVRGPVPLPGILLALGLLAEAVVSVAPLHQQPGVFSVGIPALRLDIGRHGAAHVWALVVGEAALGHGAVDHVGGTLHQAALVRVLNAQNKGTAAVPGDEPGVQGSAQVAHMHIACGRGGKASANFSPGNFSLHVVKVSHVHYRAPPYRQCDFYPRSSIQTPPRPP